MNRSIAGCMALSLGLLGGCGVVPPQVKYQEYGESVNFGYPFRQKRSVLLVKYAPASKSFTAEAAPTELDQNGNWMPLYLISGVEDWKASTQLKVTYITDTKFPDVLNITTKDKVLDTIKGIAEVAAALLPLAASAVAADANQPTATFNPTLFDPESERADQWQADPINPGYCMRIVNAAVEQGVRWADYLKTRRTTAADYPVASCAAGVLEIAACPSASQVSAAKIERLRVTYASKDRVTPIPLPSSGSLKMSAVCGASITEADNQDRRQLNNYVTGLIEGVKKVEAARKK
jgi:hypothetical protein